MDTVLSAQCLSAVDVDIDKLLTFVGVSSKNKAARLSGTVSEVVKSISSVIDEMLLLVIQQKTAQDFIEARSKVFPKYIAAVQALSQIVKAVVPDSVVEAIVYESFSELEAEFRDQGSNKFGTEVRDQALFTVWTLHKIKDLVATISKSPDVFDSVKEKDRKFAAHFGANAAWAQFHVNCLIHSIEAEKPLFPDVLSEVQDGLRAIVNAYAWARQGANLRMAEPEAAVSTPHWDEEDEELLESSMCDIDADL